MIPFSLLLTHFVADFLLQSDWMALNKGKALKMFTAIDKEGWEAGLEGAKALGTHVLVYSACFLWMGLSFALITAALHFITDLFTSQLTSKLWFFRHIPGDTDSNRWEFSGGNRHWFFVAIGFDQLLHYAGFALTLWLLS